MSRIRSRDMKPELVVRSMVHRLGYRFRLHRRDLPGAPDLVLTRHQAIIFVNGCFWHWHPDSDCPIAGLPKSNIEYWKPKLDSLVKTRFEEVPAISHICALPYVGVVYGTETVYCTPARVRLF